MDVKVFNQGSVIGLCPVSEAGQSWIDENVAVPGWAVMGKTVWCDHRMAQPIIDGLEADGLEVGS